MAKKDYSKLSPEQVAALTGAELTAYTKWLEKQSAANAAADTEATEQVVDVAAERAKEYLNAHPLINSILVTSDGEVFMDSVAGKNHADNYIASVKAHKGQLDIRKFER